MTLLGQHPKDATLLAGGTDLVVKMKQGSLQPTYLIDLKKIEELKKIQYLPGESLRIGAMATAAVLQTSQVVISRFPAIAQAAGAIGSVQIRNRATVGGNICRAAPSGDFLPILIALGTRLKVAGSGGEKSLLLQDFFLGPGLTKLGPGEMLKEIEVPDPPGYSTAVYMRHSLRETLDLATVGLAVFAAFDPENGICRDVKVVLGSVGPTPLRAIQAEKLLSGHKWSLKLVAEAAKRASEESRPINDVYGESWFKKALVESLARKALSQTERTCRASDEG